MHQSQLQMSRARGIGAIMCACLALACGQGREQRESDSKGQPPSSPSRLELPCVDPSDLPPCTEVDAHAASAASEAYGSQALISLLFARYFAEYGSEEDVEAYDAMIRAVLVHLCRFNKPDGAEDRAIVESHPIDTIFPMKALETATAAGCGYLVDKDGRRTYGSAWMSRRK
jgi:hypothetical protein